jgi:disulfide oxidoreductase YuzD
MNEQKQCHSITTTLDFPVLRKLFAFVEENEIKLMDFEKNMKLADLEIKKYEYEYKIVEIKGNIITECATILKKIISIIDKESL